MPPTDTTLSFGYWLRRQRQALDLTQGSLARQVGCATVTIQKIERDERRPSRQMAERIADALAVDAAMRPNFVAAALGERSVLQLRLADRPLDPTRPRLAHNLPIPYTPFFGRQGELAQIATRLADPTCRLLTLAGPGGIGKTRLAIAATMQHAVSFADGACFVALTGVTQGALIADEILRTLETPSPAYAWVQLVEALRGRELLLVLDNFEQLVESAGLLADLLEAAPKVKLLVTSRTRLNLAAEWLIPLAGLAVPESAASLDVEESPADDVESYSAVQLFVHGVRRLQPDVSLTSGDAAAIVRICRLLDGNPLAIELAAGWTRTLSPAAVLAELGRGLDLLATTQRDAPERHRSIRAVFDHTWTLLTPREQSILRQLAVFRGGFTPVSAAAVAGAIPADLVGIVDKSWIRMHPNGRGEMHELVRQYCEERLEREHEAQSGESVAAVYDRFGGYIVGFVRGQIVNANYASEVVGALVAEAGNIQAVWDWVVMHGTAAAGTDLANALLFLAEMTGRLHSVLQFYAAARGRLIAQLDASVERRSMAGAMLGYLEHNCCLLNRRLGLLQEMQAAVARLQALIDAGVTMPDLVQVILRDYGCHAYELGRWARAQQYHATMLHAVTTHPLDYTVVGREKGPPFWAAHEHTDLGNCAVMAGDYPAAHAEFRQASALREAIGEHRFRAHHFTRLAGLYVLEGDPMAALSIAQQAVHLSEAFGDRMGLGYAYLALGRVHAALGHDAIAQALLDDALAMGRESGELRLVLEPLAELGRLELAQGNIVAAKAHFDAGLEAFAKLGEPHSNYIVGVWLGLGWVALAEDDWDTARRRFVQTVTAQGAAAWQMLDAAAGLAEVCAVQGRVDDAAALLGLVAASPSTAAFTRRRVTQAAARLGLTLAAAPPDDWRAALAELLARLQMSPAPQ